jgi:hypothetical protein
VIDLESNNSIEKRVGDLAGGGHWGDGIELAHADQRRTADVRQLVENVARAEQFHAAHV